MRYLVCRMSISCCRTVVCAEARILPSVVLCAKNDDERLASAVAEHTLFGTCTRKM